MKQYFLIIIALFLYSCNYQKVKQIDVLDDTLFERKVPVLSFNNESLQNELDSIVEKELNCYYYKKDTTCFLVTARIYELDTVLYIASWNSHDIDFSETVLDEKKRTDGVSGYFRYKDFDFFCYTSCMKYIDLFYEANDSVKVKNSPLLSEYEPKIDDSRTHWVFIYKNKKIIELEKTTCEQF
jgi:hypothetical protein